MEEVTYKKDYVSVSTRLAKEDALKLKRKCAWMHLSPSEWTTSKPDAGIYQDNALLAAWNTRACLISMPRHRLRVIN